MSSRIGIRLNNIDSVTLVTYVRLNDTDSTVRRLSQRRMSSPLTASSSSDIPCKKLKLAAININSIASPGRIDELQTFVTENEIDILALSELKIDSTVHPHLYSLSNFHPPIIKSRTRRGGGVGIYVSNLLPFIRMDHLENDEVEAVWAKIKINDKFLVICSTYLPPHATSERQTRFLDYLTDSVTQANAHSPELIFIMGDFNAGNCWLPPDGPRHSPVSSFDDKLKSTSESIGLTQLINTATRIQEGTHNIRDLIFTDSPELIVHSGILSSFSNLDHFPIFATLSISWPVKKNVNKTQVWDYRNTDIEALVQSLSQIDWESITDKNVDEAVKTLTDKLQEVASRCIPTKTVRVRQDKPWVTTDLRRNIRKRERLFKIASSRQTDHDWARWRAQSNLVTSINRKLKNEHTKQKVIILLESRKDSYKYHKILKDIAGVRRDSEIPPLIATDGTIISDDNIKAEKFNNYFCAQTDIRITDIQREHLREYENTQSKTINHLDTIVFTSKDVLNVINGLDASKACGPDKIPTRFLKMVAIYIAEPLAVIFNKSLSEGKYPHFWKTANVKPVFKGKGSPSDLKNYRPISLLPCASKIFEKLIFKAICI